MHNQRYVLRPSEPAVVQAEGQETQTVKRLTVGKAVFKI